MVPLARRYLLSDGIRLAISAGGVTFAVVLIVLVQALYQGIYNRAGILATTAPTNLWVTQAGAPDPMHGASILSNAVLEDLRQIPDVTAVQPMLARTMELGRDANEGDFAFVMALPEGPLQIATAESYGLRSLPAKGQIMLADVAADRAGVGRGDTVYVGSSPFEVADIAALTESAFGSGTVFVSAEDARTLFGHPEAFSFGLVTIASGADPAEVEGSIEGAIPGTNALTPEAFADSTRREVEEGFLPIVTVLIGVAFVVGLAVIALTIYTSTVERTRDYGVLKAVGAAPRQLFAVVVRQSLVVALTGYALGSVLALVAGNLIQNAVPEFTVLYRWQDFLIVMGAALLMSAVAALVPVRRVASIDPAAVFRA